MNWGRIRRDLTIIIGLLVAYILLNYPIPNKYPYTVIPPLFIASIAGIVSRNYRDIVKYAVTPLILSTLAVLLRPDPYTLMKIGEAYIIFLIPYIYQVLLTTSTSIILYNTLKIFRGVDSGGK